jgi:hypothetical protein
MLAPLLACAALRSHTSTIPAQLSCVHVLRLARTTLHVALRQVFALWPEWQAELPEALQPPTTAGTATAIATAAAAAASAAAASTDAATGPQTAEAAPPADAEDSDHVAKRQKTAP